MNKFLVENEEYKVHSIGEKVYLIDKEYSDYIKVGKYIGCFCGNPNDAIISIDNRYLIVVGDYVLIYFFEKQIALKVKVYHETNWISGVYQDKTEDGNFNFFRFVGYDENNELSLFKMNIYDRIPIKVM